MDSKRLDAVSSKGKPVRKVNGCVSSSITDILSVEEPLEIRIGYGPSDKRMQKSISVTMRTPGNDLELAIGFLFTEGIISACREVEKTHHVNVDCSSGKNNIIQVELASDFTPNLMQTDRNFYTTSSCGVCGKASIESIRTISPFFDSEGPVLHLSTKVLYQLPDKLKSNQSCFSITGGIHAAGVFTNDGQLVLLREDVGRHNALDKLIGAAVCDDSLPLDRHILLLSGRASFELIQKAAMAGIAVVAAIGAPSTLAVELAAEFNITLLGFLKENRFNIYNSCERTVISDII
jgi:FdhD protein